MKLHELKEMTMAGGNFTSMADNYVLAHKHRIALGNHVGDIEQFKVLQTPEFISLWLGDEIIASLKAITVGDITEIRNIWTSADYRGLGIFSKFLWFLKTRLGFSKMLLGDIHSQDTQAVVKGGLSKFDKYWYKDGQKEEFSLDTLDKYYSPKKSTGWRIMLENDGDFSSWPKYSGTDWVRDNYDWQIE